MRINHIGFKSHIPYYLSLIDRLPSRLPIQNTNRDQRCLTSMIV